MSLLFPVSYFEMHDIGRGYVPKVLLPNPKGNEYYNFELWLLVKRAKRRVISRKVVKPISAFQIFWNEVSLRLGLANNGSWPEQYRLSFIISSAAWMIRDEMSKLLLEVLADHFNEENLQLAVREEAYNLLEDNHPVKLAGCFDAWFDSTCTHICYWPGWHDKVK